MARIDNIQTDSQGSPRRDLTHVAKLEGKEKSVDALMDTGAFYNYLSASIVATNNLMGKLRPVKNERVQLGGTSNYKDIVGRLTLVTEIKGTAARITFNVFETDRVCIIGLESLLLHFMDAFQGKLQEVRSNICALRQSPALFLSTHVFPQEPGGHVIDVNKVKTLLKKGDTIAVGDGTIAQAPEELDHGSEYKELFSIPKSNMDRYLESTAQMIDADLRAKNAIDPTLAQALAFLRSDECARVFCYNSWKGVKVEPIKIEMVKDAPPYIHARVRHINKMLYAPAQNSIMNFVADGYLVADNDCPYSSAIVVVHKPKNPEEPRICGDYGPVNEHLKRKPIALVDPKKLLDDFRSYKFFCETDWLKSFHQVPIDLETQRMLSIVTPIGCFRPRFLPEGVQPASGILAHVVRTIFGDLSKICIAAQDNLLIGGNSLQELLENFKTVIRRCADYNVILSAGKTKFGMREAPFFGYIIGNGCYRVNPERQAAISQIAFPENKKAMHSFLGMCLLLRLLPMIVVVC